MSLAEFLYNSDKEYILGNGTYPGLDHIKYIIMAKISSINPIKIYIPIGLPIC